MFDYRRFALGRLARIAPRYLPFADVASDDLPLSRLLRLSLFQVTVGMALVLLVGTLNRVMIVELQVPALRERLDDVVIGTDDRGQLALHLGLALRRRA